MSDCEHRNKNESWHERKRYSSRGERDASGKWHRITTYYVMHVKTITCNDCGRVLENRDDHEDGPFDS